jgi:hypothetical protein
LTTDKIRRQCWVARFNPASEFVNIIEIAVINGDNFHCAVSAMEIAPKKRFFHFNQKQHG